MPDHPLQDLGIVLCRIIDRIDLDGGPVLTLLVRYLFDELRQAVNCQAGAAGVDAVGLYVVIPLLARIELAILFRLQPNFRPCGTADIEALFRELPDANPGIATWVICGVRYPGTAGC